MLAVFGVLFPCLQAGANSRTGQESVFRTGREALDVDMGSTSHPWFLMPAVVSCHLHNLVCILTQRSSYHLDFVGNKENGFYEAICR